MPDRTEVGTFTARLVSLRNESDDARLNSDVLAVCRDVVVGVAGIIRGLPPLGNKPVVVQQATDGHPRACLDGLPDEYVANVTCLHGRDYARLAFQLGHELGHFCVNPNYSNWFIESACTAISYCSLAALAEKWVSAPPYPNWNSYAPSFADYRNKHVRRGLDELQLGSTADIPVWLRDSLPAIVQNDLFSRYHEALCAEAISDVMSAHPEACSALVRLGEASHAGRSDFALWRASASPNETEFIDILSELFSHA